MGEAGWVDILIPTLLMLLMTRYYLQTLHYILKPDVTERLVRYL